MKKTFTLFLLIFIVNFVQSQIKNNTDKINLSTDKENSFSINEYTLLAYVSPKVNYGKQYQKANINKSKSFSQNWAPNVNAPITTAGSISSCPNISFNIPITVTNFSNVGAMTLRLDYDTTLLRYNGYSNGNASFSSGTGLTINSAVDSLTLKKIMIVWYHTTPVNLSNGSKIVDLNFTILSGAPTLKFNNISNSGGDCGYASGLGEEYIDSISSTYYINASITNLGVGNPGNISGSSAVCRGQNNVTYTVPPISNATSYIWTLPTGATGTSSTNTITVNYGASSISGNITVKGSNTSCGNGNAANFPVTVSITPSAAGSISGSAAVCQGQSNVTYTVPTISNATSYIWAYSGTGVIISGTTNSVTLSFSSTSTAGNLTVYGHNICFDGTISANFPITVNPLPLAAGLISGSILVCQGQNSVLYSVPTITNATSYSWTLPTGASGTTTTNSITVTFGTSAVSSDISVKGNNNCGYGISSGKSVTVNPLPLAAGNISGLTTVCQGQHNVIYTVTAINNATSYIWSLPAGVSGTSTTNSITVAYGTASNSGNITVKGNNACGDGISSSLSVIVNPLPVASGSITGLSTVCQGESNIIYTIPSITNATSYIWSLPTGATGISSTNSITVNYGASAISGIITVKGNNTCGDGVSSFLTITVNPLPLAAGIISGSTTVCQGENNITYTVPSITNATSYIWSLPTGSSGNSSSNLIMVNYGISAVSGNITVKGNNACGEGFPSNILIHVNPLPDTAKIISGLTSVCQGQNNVLYTIAAITNASTYTWTLPSGATGNSTTNSISVNYGTSATSGNISVKGNNACGDGILSSLSINVNPLPLAAGNISGSQTVFQGESNVVYTVPTITNATTYNWSLPFGASGIITANSISVDYNASSNSGNISVTGENACGTGSASALAITVLCTPPSTQAALFTTSAITNNKMIIGWTRGNGNSVLVIARQGSAVNANPDNGTSYTADSIYGNGTEIGSGNYVVYKGSGISTTITSLTSESIYHFAVYEYNATNACYKIPALPGSAVTSSLNSTFTAAVSNAWEISDNWDHGIPSSVTNVIIPSDKLAVVNSNNLQCNNLSIAPLGKLTINNGNELIINGILRIQSNATGSGSLIHSYPLNATVECYIPHTYPLNQDEFHMLASPVSMQAISPDFNQQDGFYVWNELTGNWIEYDNGAGNFLTVNGGTNFIPAKGYAVSYPAETTKVFSGLLNQGNINIPLTHTTGIYSGFNFIANPYPSAINWDAITGWTRDALEDAGGSQNALWIWNASVGNYGTYISNSGIGSNNVTANIAIAQGYWVKALSSGTLGMTNEIREHSPQTFLKSTPTDILRIKIKATDDFLSDELVLKFGNSNNQSGAEKMFSLLASSPSIYSSKLNKKWSIDMLSSTNNPIQIGFKPGKDAFYNLSISGTEFFNDQIILKDLKTGIQYNLSTNNIYSFSALQSDNQDRFLLSFCPKTMNNIVDQKLKISYREHILNISNPWTGNTTLFIYNTKGQMIQSSTINTGNTNLNFNQVQGIYIFKIVNDQHIIVKKEMIY